jgi:hypothetical protein
LDKGAADARIAAHREASCLQQATTAARDAARGTDISDAVHDAITFAYDTVAVLAYERSDAARKKRDVADAQKKKAEAQVELAQTFDYVANAKWELEGRSWRGYHMMLDDIYVPEFIMGSEVEDLIQHRRVCLFKQPTLLAEARAEAIEKYNEARAKADDKIAQLKSTGYAFPEDNSYFEPHDTRANRVAGWKVKALNASYEYWEAFAQEDHAMADSYTAEAEAATFQSEAAVAYAKAAGALAESAGVRALDAAARGEYVEVADARKQPASEHEKLKLADEKRKEADEKREEASRAWAEVASDRRVVANVRYLLLSARINYAVAKAEGADNEVEFWEASAKRWHSWGEGVYENLYLARAQKKVSEWRTFAAKERDKVNDLTSACAQALKVQEENAEV